MTLESWSHDTQDDNDPFIKFGRILDEKNVKYFSLKMIDDIDGFDNIERDLLKWHFGPKGALRLDVSGKYIFIRKKKKLEFYHGDSDKRYTTPICKAIINKDYQQLQMLVDSGADVNAKDRAIPPIVLAAFKGDLQSFEIIFFAHVDEKVKREILHAAVCCPEACALEIVRFLVENGYDVNDNSNDRGYILQVAAGASHLSVVEYLLSAGADPNVVDDNGMTPLDGAMRHCRIDNIRLLKKYE